MARAPDHRAEIARDMFLTGKKLVDIANELGVPDSTVRRWKHTYKWEGERSEKVIERSKRKGERSEKKTNARKEETKAVADEVIQVVDNPDLTDMQRLFCILYVRCFNATKAAIKAGYSRNSAMEQGYQLLRNPSVKGEIARLKQHRLNQAMLEEADIFQKYMDIAFSDITDYVEFGREEVQVMGAFGPVQVDDPETGEKKTLTKEINSVRFRESNEVDGTLITEVKQGKDGASIKLADRMRALDWLAEHMDLATAEQRARVAQLRAQTDKLTGNNEEIEDMGEVEGDIYGGK
ncbi:terminase small subunit [Enterocloster asparagiformis]|uniref:Terminase small subunit n=1 Tax=[Clostridium] asparagiforme DSM 15981 TaxID=518636 RepID=C0CSR3_9FIRM|nr:terminase small subunit [Enterocloster asparagiformis]EEG57882.1 terminase small subunit [[Clostridium] asparagiforme DSM 15981]UWO77469.1 terminase small subunit [[Clostridium] asparagiforme DSM 15981]